MHKNILLSTSYGWNCGDDFIAFGVRNLLDSILPEVNYIIYNRNPDLHKQRTLYNELKIKLEDGRIFKINLDKYINKTNWVWDNSWHIRNNFDNIDYCIFAGTPEWFGKMVSPMVSILSETNLPVIYLGVGGFEGRENLSFENLPESCKSVLRRSKLLTTRDSQAQNLLSKLGSHQLPCPALFSSIKETPRVNNNKLKIALSTQPDLSIQPLSSKGVYDYTLKLFSTLKEEFNCEVVCHYIDEIKEMSHLNIPIRYSYNADDYFKIYNKYDLVITTRVHGAGASASLGVPSFVISHSKRTETVRGFLSELITPNTKINDVVDKIRSFDIHKRSLEIIEHKKKIRDIYIEKLKPIIK
ncbi:polysaccharide pyruvyl transferase family protein [Prochlorococcus marinus]|uniref:polysaccharide pyruvyl transferase family protein n=1 Tax=Prochlorococcus marinus TaxID=1219 RepID=UPI0022B4A34C|nr:polysaccharide pyruvyl transferase family protein [Prochlorococcus marinus]